MNFSENYMNKATVVLQEARKLKKYAAMPKVFAIITGILMLPIFVAGMICAAILYALGYLFSLLSIPSQKLHAFVHEEGQTVKGATQFLIYLFSWGLVFGSYVALAFLPVVLTVLYSVFAILTYIWTLGGIQFHVFTAGEDVSVQVCGKYPSMIPILFIAVSAVILLLFPAIRSVADIIAASEYMKITFKLFFEYFGEAFRMYFSASIRPSILFSALYSAAVFAPLPKQSEE